MYLVLTLNPSFAPLREYIGAPLFTSVVIFEDRTGTWLFRDAEAAALGWRMIDFLSVPANRSAFEDRLVTTANGLLELFDSVLAADLGVEAVETLIDRFESLVSSFTAFYELGAFVEPVQIAAQGWINSYMEAHADQLSDETELDKALLTDTVYALGQESFAVAISEGLSRCAAAMHAFIAKRGVTEQSTEQLVEILADSGDDELESVLATHCRSFWWSRNNYERCVEVTPVDVIQEVLAIGAPSEAAAQLERQVQEARASVGTGLDAKARLLRALPAYEAGLVSLHDLVGGHLLDERKHLVMRFNGTVTRVLSALADELRVDLAELLYLLPQELQDYCVDPDAFVERLARRKEATLVYQADFGVLDELAMDDEFEPMDGPYLAEGEEATDSTLHRLSERLNIIRSSAGQRPLTGTTVYFDRNKPLLSGVVRVVRDPIHDRLNEDEVLVASSTTPDFMSAIHRCAAIITDWGGQTSHAAITARELKKPCIIGTNFGSSVLRTGDRVQIDFETGEVTKEANDAGS